MDAGELVRALRDRHDLSQAALAYRAGTTQQAISRLEQGRVSPTVEMLARIAAACGEELTLDARPRGVPFEDAQLELSGGAPVAMRAELALAWNEFAGELTAAGARARERA